MDKALYRYPWRSDRYAFVLLLHSFQIFIVWWLDFPKDIWFDYFSKQRYAWGCENVCECCADGLNKNSREIFLAVKRHFATYSQNLTHTLHTRCGKKIWTLYWYKSVQIFSPYHLKNIESPSFSGILLWVNNICSLKST